MEVYFCDARKFLGRYEEAAALLPKERREKASRLLKYEDRLLSALSGLMLKKVLGVDRDGMLLYNEHGKPYLEHGKCFSISHSGDFAVLAVSEDKIGADIEIPKRVNESVMHRCFTKAETAFVNGSPESFARIWTLKEAAVKLLGKGIGFPLKSFSVLPFDEKHFIGGTEMYFFSILIMGAPFGAATSRKETEFKIKEFEPEELLGLEY